MDAGHPGRTDAFHRSLRMAYTLIAMVVASAAGARIADASSNYADALGGFMIGATLDASAELSRDSRGTLYTPMSIAGQSGTMYIGTCAGVINSLGFQIDVTNLSGTLPSTWKRADDPASEAKVYLSTLVLGLQTAGWSKFGPPITITVGETGLIQEYHKGTLVRLLGVSCYPESTRATATHCAVSLVAKSPTPCTDGM